jgi:aryl-alcohol dehydrogenase-like predicted oxidoreductase
MTMRPGPYEHLRDDAVFDLLEDLERRAAAEGTTMASLAIEWLLANPQVTAVIVGPRSPAQLEPAVTALAG